MSRSTAPQKQVRNLVGLRRHVVDLFDVETGEPVEGITSISVHYEVGGLVRADLKLLVAEQGIPPTGEK
jgi:hypothetical protein